MSNLKHKILLLRGLVNGEFAHAGPMYVCVDITRRCNLRCTGCVSHGSGEKRYIPGDYSVMDIPLPLVKRLSRELQGMGTRMVSLSGEGEPLLHKQLFQIITAFKQAGMHVTLFTNGTLLSGETTTALFNSGLDILKVSLWGNSSEEYGSYHKGTEPSSFTEILESLSTISRLKGEMGIKNPGVFINHIIARNTYVNIGMKVDLAYKTGCNGVLFHPFASWGSETSAEELAPKQITELYADLVRVKGRMDSLYLDHNIGETLLKYRLGKSAWRVLPCYTARHQARIRVDGTVMPCARCHDIMGNLVNQSFAEIWNGEVYHTFRRQGFGNGRLNVPVRYRYCDWCCTLKVNYRIHRLFKWIAPLIAHG